MLIRAIYKAHLPSLRKSLKYSGRSPFFRKGFRTAPQPKLRCCFTFSPLRPLSPSFLPFSSFFAFSSFPSLMFPSLSLPLPISLPPSPHRPVPIPCCFPPPSSPLSFPSHLLSLSPPPSKPYPVAGGPESGTSVTEGWKGEEFWRRGRRV